MAFDPYYNSVSLLLPMEGANNSTTFVDNSPSPKTITRYGNTQILTAQSKWGAGSGYFDGSGDYLSIAHHANLSLLGEFTLEFWIYTGTASKAKSVLQKGRTSSFLPNYSCSITSGGTIFCSLGRSQVNLVRDTIAGATDITNSAWRHICFVATTTQLLLFVDGVQDATPVTRTIIPIDSENPMIIGDYGSDDEYITGYLQDLRITKGVARYTDNFTPPNAAWRAASIGGTCTVSGNGGAQQVVVRHAATCQLAALATLDEETGVWTATVQADDYDISYFAAGCRPVTHGPYTVVSS